MKFGVESLLHNENVFSGRKTPSAVKNKGSSDPILENILAGDNKSNSVSDWLTGENDSLSFLVAVVRCG